jgi:hypothetical protein
MMGSRIPLSDVFAGKVTLADALKSLFVSDVVVPTTVQRTHPTTRPEPEPFDGDLTPEQVSTLQKLPQHQQSDFEAALRQYIAMYGDNNPELVGVDEFGGALLMLRKPARNESAPT